MADTNGWQRLGAALGGGDTSEMAYQEGRALGAKTEDALAQARRRVDENVMREQSAQLMGDLLAGGQSPTDEALSLTGLARGGLNLGDMLGGRGKLQEQRFRETAADPNVPLGTGNRALMGVASGPVDPLKAVGRGGYQNIFEPEAGVLPLGDAMGGDTDMSNQVELIEYVKNLNADGWAQMSPLERQAAAIDILRNTSKTFDAGGVEYGTSTNPFRTPAGATPGTGAGTRPLVGAGNVAANVAEIERAKGIGKGAGESFVNLPKSEATFRNHTAKADTAIALIDKAIADVSGWTAGPGGKVMGTLWGSPGYDLGAAIDTIKASAGFRELQSMRAESPTGAALGQVAVQELNFLQAMVGNLDRAQSPEQLRNMLGLVRTSYDRFKSAAAEDFAREQQRATGGVPGLLPALPGADPQAAAPAGERKVVNGKTFVKVNGQWFEDDGT